MHIIKTIIPLIVFCFSLGCSATTSDNDAQKYWGEFRAASLANDYSTLSQLIQFPLEVKGVTDDIPVIKYNINNLSTIFPVLMSQTLIQYKGNDNYVKVTFRDVIKNTTVINVAADEDEFSVEQFTFRRVNSKWHLVQAYLEE